MEGSSGHGHHVAGCNYHMRPAEGAVEAHVVRTAGEEARLVGAHLLPETRLPLDCDLPRQTTNQLK